MDTDYPVHLYDDYDSDTGTNNADNNEVPRGRKRMSTNGLPSKSSLPRPVLELGRTAEIPRGLSSTPSPPLSPRSSILISPSSLNIPLSPNPYTQPDSRSRPRTPISPSRPGTPGDGTTSPIRHNRLDSILHRHVQGHLTPPPTRSSSPSRSVRSIRFADY